MSYLQGNRRRILLGLCLLVMFVLGVIAGRVIQKPVLVQAHGMPATDFADDRKLAGFADNVWFGRVKGQLGSRQFSGLVETQFDVEVIEQLKGELSADKVTVSQAGGWDPWRFRFVILGGDLPLVEGDRYLFFTTRNEIDGKIEHWLASSYGDIPIESDEHMAALRAKYQTAIDEQVPFGADNLDSSEGL